MVSFPQMPCMQAVFRLHSFLYDLFSDARAKHKEKVGIHLEYKTTGSVCPVTEHVTRT